MSNNKGDGKVAFEQPKISSILGFGTTDLNKKSFAIFGLHKLNHEARIGVLMDGRERSLKYLILSPTFLENNPQIPRFPHTKAIGSSSDLGYYLKDIHHEGETVYTFNQFDQYAESIEGNTVLIGGLVYIHPHNPIFEQIMGADGFKRLQASKIRSGQISYLQEDGTYSNTGAPEIPSEVLTQVDGVTTRDLNIASDLITQIRNASNDDQILEQRIEEMRKNLRDKAVGLVTIVVDGQKFSITSHSKVVNNTEEGLAPYFGFRVQVITADRYANRSKEWLAAIRKAATFEGVVKFEPPADDPHAVISRTDNGYFEKIEARFPK